jgi:serine protease
VLPSPSGACYKDGMCRFLLPFVLGLLASFAAQAQSGVVAHGLIVQLKPGAQSEFSRELPFAAQAKRESLAHQRMAVVAQGAGVKDFAHRHLTGDHRLLRFAQPLQGATLEDTMRRLRLHPDVASVTPNVRMRLAQLPNDPAFALQWQLGSRASAPAALEMSSTWAITTGTAAITVAVLDTGIVKNHPDLRALGNRLLDGYDFVEEVELSNDGDGRDSDASDPGDFVTLAESQSTLFRQLGCGAEPSSWHGSFIAGQIGAATNNNQGIAGLNWNARILPVRVSAKCGASLSDILDGMRWAAGLAVEGVPLNRNPAKVINLSFGGDVPCTSDYQSVIDELAAVGTLVVVAAGNGEGSDSRLLKRPADCRGVMAVGAVQRDGAKTDYSFVGSSMALMAPGGHGRSISTLLLSADNFGSTTPVVDNDPYGYKQGTSFSAPFAAGVASLMLAINPSLTPDALIARMKSSALPHVISNSYRSCDINQTVACNCTAALCGAGLLNPLGAVQASASPAAVIAAVGQPSVGTIVTLDGRTSVAIGTATLVNYAWRLVDGPSVSISNANASVTQVVLPSAPGSFEFKLTVSDSLARTGESSLRVTTEARVALAGAGGSGEGGGGAESIAWLAWLVALAALILVGAARRRRSSAPISEVTPRTAA